MFSILTRRPGARFWREHEFLYDADKQTTKATSLWNNEGPRPRVLTIRFQDSTCTSEKEAGTWMPQRPWRNLNLTLAYFDHQNGAKKRVAAVSIVFSLSTGELP